LSYIKKTDRNLQHFKACKGTTRCDSQFQRYFYQLTTPEPPQENQLTPE